MRIQNIHYAFPELAFLFIFIIPMGFLYWNLFRYRQQSLDRYAKRLALEKLLIPRSSLLFFLKIGALHFAWLFGCLALMEPQGNPHYLFSPKKIEKQTARPAAPAYRPHDIIFLIDSSASMTVADSSNGETRLDRAKRLAQDIVGRLKGQNVALYAFTSDLIPLVPLTMDYLFFQLVLKELKINEGDIEGTDIKQALLSLKNKLFKTPSSKLTTVILISDGGDNQIEKLQGQAKEQAIQTLLNIIPDPLQFNLRIFTIGVGSLQGGRFPMSNFRDDRFPLN